jgi:uncharacterized protein (TIGR03000 family)
MFRPSVQVGPVIQARLPSGLVIPAIPLRAVPSGEIRLVPATFPLNQARALAHLERVEARALMLSTYSAGMGYSSPYYQSSYVMSSYVPTTTATSGGGSGGSATTTYQAQQITATLPTAADIEVSGPLDTPPPHRGMIRLRLPTNRASVSINGRKIDEMGRTRYYVTPELSGSTTFDVSATWAHNGQTTSKQDTVTLRAGQIRTVDFRSSGD